jgi:hypothetical protein
MRRLIEKLPLPDLQNTGYLPCGQERRRLSVESVGPQGLKPITFLPEMWRLKPPPTWKQIQTEPLPATLWTAHVPSWFPRLPLFRHRLCPRLTLNLVQPDICKQNYGWNDGITGR